MDIPPTGCILLAHMEIPVFITFISVPLFNNFACLHPKQLNGLVLKRPVKTRKTRANAKHRKRESYMYELFA